MRFAFPCTSVRAATVVLLGSAALAADTWMPPKKEMYVSPNRRFGLEVVPRDVEKRKGSCQGTLYELGPNGSRSRIWSVILSNRVAPASALVANSGQYAVTFDNWGRVGYGDDVVVIYGAGGRLIRKFSLEELLGKDVKRVPRTVSSRWWSGEQKHEMDEANGVLILKAELIQGMPVKTVRTIRVALQSGAILAN